LMSRLRGLRRKRNGIDVSASPESKRHQRAKLLWDKYGLPGLAFISPFFVGSHLSALLEITVGRQKAKTLYLMTASLLAWTVVLGVASLYGFDYFIADEENLGFITRFIHD